MSSYNGWTNYATWRLNLELFDGASESYNMRQNTYDLSLELKDYATEAIEASSSEGLARDYALAFLSDVNWYEIAEKMMEEYTEEVTE